jgi:hypothetical protein
LGLDAAGGQRFSDCLAPPQPDIPTGLPLADGPSQSTILKVAIKMSNGLRLSILHASHTAKEV